MRTPTIKKRLSKNLPAKFKVYDECIITKGVEGLGSEGRPVILLRKQTVGNPEIKLINLWEVLYFNETTDWVPEANLVKYEKVEKKEVEVKVIVKDPERKISFTATERINEERLRRDMSKAKVDDMVQIIGPKDYLAVGVIGIVTEVDKKLLGNGKEEKIWTVMYTGKHLSVKETYCRSLDIELILDKPRIKVKNYDCAMYLYEMKFDILGKPNSKFKNITPEILAEIDERCFTEYPEEYEVCKKYMKEFEKKRKLAELNKLMRDMEKLEKML